MDFWSALFLNNLAISKNRLVHRRSLSGYWGKCLVEKKLCRVKGVALLCKIKTIYIEIYNIHHIYFQITSETYLGLFFPGDNGLV